MPLRVGTIGKPLAFSGFNPIKSYVGRKDLFGRKSRLTQSNVVDSLAAGAVLMMGEGNEQIPLAIIKKAPVKFSNKKGFSLAMSPEKDIYTYIYKTLILLLYIQKFYRILILC